MDSISGIYEIRNTTNGHRYIGSAVNIKTRWTTHVWRLTNNIHHSIHLQRAWNKYGKDCFEFSLLELCEKDALIDREQYYLDTLIPEYNILRRAGSNIGLSFSDAVKERMSLLRKGFVHSQETKDKISASHMGMKYSKETKEKLSNMRKGVTLSDEHKKKLSEATKAHYARLRIQKEGNDE